MDDGALDIDRLFQRLDQHCLGCVSGIQHSNRGNKPANIMVAVSGGSDSIGMLVLAHAWAIRGSHKLYAVTIDHGLRAKAAEEAAFVRRICDRLNIPHETIAWRNPVKGSGLQHAARTARYTLLGDWAKQHQCSSILTGHTRDDQAETIAMRLRRSIEFKPGRWSGSRGLAGMAPATRLLDEVKLVRPLLDVSRSSLRQYLADLGQAWIEDPSNQDCSFERVRMRVGLKDQTHYSSQLLHLGDLMGRYRSVISAQCAHFFSTHLTQELPSGFCVPLTGLLQLPEPVALMSIKYLVGLAGGQSYLISDKDAARILQQFLAWREIAQKGDDKKRGRARLTLGRAMVSMASQNHEIGFGKGPTRRSGEGTDAAADYRCLFQRENRHLPMLRIGAGQQAYWDGRYWVQNETAHPITIMPGAAVITPEKFPDIIDWVVSDSVNEQLLQTLEGDVPIDPAEPIGWFENGRIICLARCDETRIEVGRNDIKQGIRMKIRFRAVREFCPNWDEALLQTVDKKFGEYFVPTGSDLAGKINVHQTL